MAACLLAFAAAPAQAKPERPGSPTYDRPFCKLSELPAADQRPAVGLAVEDPTVPPGRAAFARVENRSSEQIQFGVEYHVQRYAQGRWRHAPGAPTGPWIQIAVLLAPHHSGSCMHYRVPADAPPGRYRFTKKLIAGSGPAHAYSAPFRVTR